MKYISNNELTLTNTVPQLVACRTSDLQLAYKWTHCVHTALAGSTTVGVGHAFVHICRRRTTVTVCEITGGRGRWTEGIWLWSGGEADSRSSWWTRPGRNSSPWLAHPCSLTVTMMGINESAADVRQQKNTKLTKEVILMSRSLRHSRKLHVLLFACMKITTQKASCAVVRVPEKTSHSFLWSKYNVKVIFKFILRRSIRNAL